MGVSLCGGLRCTQATHAGLFNPPGLLGGIREFFLSLFKKSRTTGSLICPAVLDKSVNLAHDL